jgi:hypothetical protein
MSTTTTTKRSRAGLAGCAATALVLVALASAQTATACSHHCHRIKINAGSHQAIEPHRLLSLSGDGSFYVTKLRHWHHWNHRKATAHGKAHLNDCVPYCAAGTFHTYPAFVRVSRPLNCGGGHKSYSKILVRFNGRHIKRRFPRPYACQ